MRWFGVVLWLVRWPSFLSDRRGAGCYDSTIYAVKVTVLCDPAR